MRASGYQRLTGGQLEVIVDAGAAATGAWSTSALGQPLSIDRQAPVGMHPGPVVLPVVLAVGAEATAPLRWVSGEVYSPSRCYTPTTAALTLELADPRAAVLTAPFQGRICGPARGSRFEQPPLRLDPAPPSAR